MILFLDIDGVLNNTDYPMKMGPVSDFASFQTEWRQKYDTPYLCPHNIENFIEFVNEYSEPIYCILSSSWRFGGEKIIDKLNYVFKDFGCHNPHLIIGRTGKNKGWGYRGEEIKESLDYILKEGDIDLISQVKNKNYIILDDDNDFLEEQQKSLFLCNSSNGFTKNVGLKILNIKR